MKAAIYARKSTDKQSSDSPADQIARCRDFAAAPYAGSLRAAEAPLAEAFTMPAALDMLAGVCVAVHGTPGELMEGRLLE